MILPNQALYFTRPYSSKDLAAWRASQWAPPVDAEAWVHLGLKGSLKGYLMRFLQGLLEAPHVSLGNNLKFYCF